VPVPGAPFDVVAANISALVLKNAARDLAEAVKPGGPAILSGILVTGADDVRSTYEAAGWRHVETRVEGDWVAMVVRRREA
jgi:ribosomal protein L11 methyltransferase